MRYGYTPVAPNEEQGRALMDRYVANGGGAATVISIDTDALRADASMWQALSERLHAAAAEVRTIAEKADAAADGFREEYQTRAEYDSDYSAMKTTERNLYNKLTEAAEQAARLAGACAWIADNKDDAEEYAAKRAESIDADLGADGGSTTAAQAHPKRDDDGAPSYGGNTIPVSTSSDSAVVIDSGDSGTQPA